MNQAETVKSPERTEKTKMVHLGLPGTPVSATFCGAVTSKEYPAYTEADCVVCAEMARAAGYDV